VHTLLCQEIIVYCVWRKKTSNQDVIERFCTSARNYVVFVLLRRLNYSGRGTVWPVFHSFIYTMSFKAFYEVFVCSVLSGFSTDNICCVRRHCMLLRKLYKSDRSVMYVISFCFFVDWNYVVSLFRVIPSVCVKRFYWYRKMPDEEVVLSDLSKLLGIW
jgi:hypothetical protein